MNLKNRLVRSKDEWIDEKDEDENKDEDGTWQDEIFKYCCILTINYSLYTFDFMPNFTFELSTYYLILYSGLCYIYYSTLFLYWLQYYVPELFS